MTTKIPCPACGAKGHIVSLNADCIYCRGTKRVALVPHLRLIGHFEEAVRAEHLQKRMGKHHPKRKNEQHQQDGLALKVNG